MEIERTFLQKVLRWLLLACIVTSLPLFLLDLSEGWSLVFKIVSGSVGILFVWGLYMLLRDMKAFSFVFARIVFIVAYLGYNSYWAFHRIIISKFDVTEEMLERSDLTRVEKDLLRFDCNLPMEQITRRMIRREYHTLAGRMRWINAWKGIRPYRTGSIWEEFGSVEPEVCS